MNSNNLFKTIDSSIGELRYLFNNIKEAADEMPSQEQPMQQQQISETQNAGAQQAQDPNQPMQGQPMQQQPMQGQPMQQQGPLNLIQAMDDQMEQVALSLNGFFQMYEQFRQQWMAAGVPGGGQPMQQPMQQQPVQGQSMQQQPNQGQTI